MDDIEETKRTSLRKSTSTDSAIKFRSSITKSISESISSSRRSSLNEDGADGTANRMRSSAKLLGKRNIFSTLSQLYSSYLMQHHLPSGAYSNLLENDSKHGDLVEAYAHLDQKKHQKIRSTHVDPALNKVLNDMMRESRSLDRVRQAFDRFDTDDNGELDLQEFKDAYKQVSS
jgi:Ca2+-binding EF-hand superfamily protein